MAIITVTDLALIEHLKKRFTNELIYTPGGGWHEYRKGRWERVVNVHVLKLIQLELKAIYMAECSSAKTPSEASDISKAFRRVLSAGLPKSLIDLLAGHLLVADDALDADPYLLNCRNGVVDLRTGELRDHAPGLLMTRQTSVAYRPGATHPLWDEALEAVPASIHPWYAQQFGAALIGTILPGGVIVINQGGGSNGKTTLLGTCSDVLGDYSTLLDDKVLTAPSNAHSTETADLKGARLALLEETEQAGKLNVNRVKKLADTEIMKARRMYRDPMEWRSSHTIFVNTNHRPVITETDHGTWRRLALVVYPRKFPPSDFRDRVKARAVREAALAWMVQGALDLLAGPLPLPDQVQRDTLNWRSETDLILAFFQERIEKEPAAAILSADMLDEFNRFIGKRGNARNWEERELNPAIETHDAMKGITKKRTRALGNLSRPFGREDAPVPDQATVWQGVAFVDDSDERIHEATTDWAELVRLASF